MDASSVIEETFDTDSRSITKATVFGYIRLNISLKTQIIPDEIMMICYNYYGHDFISSLILNGAERDKLFRLLLTRQPTLVPGTTRKIFTGSIDGFDANSFYSKCDGICNSIVIIKSNWGSCFGAFTRIAWTFDGGYHGVNDLNDTFLWNLDSNQTFSIKQRDFEYAIYHGGNGSRDLDSDLIFYFGAAAGLLLYDNCNERDDNFAYGGDKCGYEIGKGNLLCGGNKLNMHYDDKYEFRVVNYELFVVDIDENMDKNDHYKQ